MPKLSYPFAIFASVLACVLGALLWKGVIHWEGLVLFATGTVIPLWKAESTKSAAVPPLPVLFFGVLFVSIFGFVAVACTKQQTSKTEYGAQVQACVEVSHTRDEFETCFYGVQIKWNEAGAPPALVMPKDGGVQ